MTYGLSSTRESGLAGWLWGRLIPSSSASVPRRLVSFCALSSFFRMPLRANHLTFGFAVAIVAIASGCDAHATPIPPTRPFVVVANQRAGVATLVEVASGRVFHVE